jgi:hypothetical protein
MKHKVIAVLVLIMVMVMFGLIVPSTDARAGYYYELTGPGQTSSCEGSGAVVYINYAITYVAYLPAGDSNVWSLSSTYGPGDGGNFSLGPIGPGAVGYLTGGGTNAGAPPVTLTAEVITSIAGVPLGWTRIRVTCTAAGATPRFTISSSYVTEKTTTEVVPGCDTEMPITATSVVGSFVTDATLYWVPGELVAPQTTISAGQTAWVLGVDATGMYYKIMWACDLVWVPINAMGPNFDATWNGRPLPTEVVN